MDEHADPFHPQVTGFDLPPAGPGAAQTVVALLDGTPARSWKAVFTPLAELFRVQQQLDEVRLVGRVLSLTGRIADARALAAEAKALLHRVSRQCMQQRLTAMDALDDGDDRRAPRDVAQDQVLLRDLASVAAVPGLHPLLEAVARATGMRLAAVARITDERWTACAVYDQIDFGLRPGQDLDLETTICNEIRQNPRTVHFDRASTHPVYAGHPTPAMYGFESYISTPILRPDGSFFGTLFALDPEPALLDDATVRAVEVFAATIGRELAAPAAKASQGR
jgi:hypothetical protein